MRRRGKPDANQAAVVEDLRRIPGCSVLVLSAVGNGCPDLLIGYRGANFLVELKNPERRPSENPGPEARQQKFRDSWHGQVLKSASFMDIVNFITGGPHV